MGNATVCTTASSRTAAIVSGYVKNRLACSMMPRIGFIRLSGPPISSDSEAQLVVRSFGRTAPNGLGPQSRPALYLIGNFLRACHDLGRQAGHLRDRDAIRPAARAVEHAMRKYGPR